MKMASLRRETLKVSLFCTFVDGKKICYATMQLLSDLLHAPNLMLMLTAK